jgi:hypothetical protein
MLDELLAPPRAQARRRAASAPARFAGRGERAASVAGSASA